MNWAATRLRALQRLKVAFVFLLTASPSVAQNTYGPAAISRTTSNLFVSWSGIGTLQSSPTPPGPWQDILEASSPFGPPPTNAQQFFRAQWLP